MKLVVAIVLLSVVGYVVWNQTYEEDEGLTETEKVSTTSVIVETKDGQKIPVTQFLYDADSWFRNDPDSTVELRQEIGSFQFHCDLREVKYIKVLDGRYYNLTLEVGFISGEIITGKRSELGNKVYSSAFDYVKGKSGRIDVSLSIENIVSITQN